MNPAGLIQDNTSHSANTTEWVVRPIRERKNLVKDESKKKQTKEQRAHCKARGFETTKKNGIEWATQQQEL